MILLDKTVINNFWFGLNKYCLCQRYPVLAFTVPACPLLDCPWLLSSLIHVCYVLLQDIAMCT